MKYTVLTAALLWNHMALETGEQKLTSLMYSAFGYVVEVVLSRNNSLQNNYVVIFSSTSCFFFPLHVTQM